MSSLNFMELCRLCLVKERVSIPIFEGEGDVRQILLKIGACLPVKVARDDKLPKKICDECMFKLDSAYQFWNSSASAEKQLLQWLGDATNEDRKNVPSNTIETEQLVLKEEAIDQDTPEPSKNLNRVETVLDDERGASDDDEDSESEEEGSNSEETGDDEPPGKEEAESEEEPYEPLEPTTFVNVSLAGSDEAGPSGIQQPAQAAVAQPGQSQQPSQLAPSTSSAAGAASTAASATTAAVAPSPTSAAAVASTPSGLVSAREVNPLGKTPFLCFDCGREFTSEFLLNIHIKAYHPPGGKFICTHCEKVFICRSKFVEHVKIHGTRKHPCPECKKEFRKKSLLAKHMVMHTNERPFECDICHAKLKTKQNLKIHKNRTHGDLKKSHICDVCEFATIDKWSLRSHYRTHFKDFQYHCQICNKKFYMKCLYEEHMKGIHGGQELPCHICGKVFALKHSLKDHLNTHDVKLSKRYVCDTCGKGFPFQSKLNRHMLKHAEIARFICDVCGKALTTNVSLETHRRTHTGEKPFACDVCKKTFNAKNSLRVHLRTHTGSKPYKCQECGKSFSQHSPLTIHMRYHTGERPYKCMICNKDFVTRTLLNSHIKSHP